jgi:hypothetical protein
MIVKMLHLDLVCLFPACAAADGLRHGAAHVACADKTKGIFHKGVPPDAFSLL